MEGKVIGKVLALLLFIFLAFALMTGYLFLTGKIVSGEQQITDGQAQLEKGEKTLAQGKAKLASGKRTLSQVKTAYRGVKVLPVVGIVALPVTGVVLGVASNNISEGDKQVARGEASVKMGEGRVEAGKMALNQGKGRLVLANKIRLGCVLGAIFFAALVLVLGFYWWRSLITLFRKS
jgi:hypothetical protein